MKTVAQLIYKALTEDAVVSAIVGAKVFPLLADQELAVPYITYRVTELDPATKDAAADFRIEIDSYHKTYYEVLDLDTAVVNALEEVSYSGSNYRFKLAGATPFITPERHFSITRVITIKK